MAFKYRGRLEKHMRTHSDVTYNCKLCEKSVKNEAYFAQHMSCHGITKLWKCNMCDQEFDCDAFFPPKIGPASFGGAPVHGHQFGQVLNLYQL